MFLHIPRRKTSLSFYPWRHGDVIEGIIIDINKDVFCFFNPGKQINIIFFSWKKGETSEMKLPFGRKHTHMFIPHGDTKVLCAC